MGSTTNGRSSKQRSQPHLAGGQTASCELREVQKQHPKLPRRLSFVPSLPRPRGPKAMAISRPRSANVSLQTFPDAGLLVGKLGRSPWNGWSLLWRSSAGATPPPHPACPWFLSGAQMIRHQHPATWEADGGLLLAAREETPRGRTLHPASHLPSHGGLRLRGTRPGRLRRSLRHSRALLDSHASGSTACYVRNTERRIEMAAELSCPIRS